MREKPDTIDAYLTTLERERRPPLDQLRRAIRRRVPAAEECISYGMPAFRVDGGVVAGFAATKDGYSYYPFSGQTLAVLKSELLGFEGTKSSLHFTVERPLPVTLLRKLLQTRLTEIQRRQARPKKASPRRRKRVSG
jgi:uncharacterized protein YdhG (YjbR/CyaY superfamily)